MLRIAFSALVSRARTGLNGLAAASLLQEALEALTRAKAAHWGGSSIADVPEMIQELARDRDDYKRMAEDYRTQLADAEERVEFHSNLRRENLDIYLAEVERLMKANHKLRTGEDT